MNLNFELNLYVAKLLIIVWIILPYLALKYIKLFRIDYTSKLEYLFLYLLCLLVPAFLVFTLQLTYQAIYPIFNILFLTW